MCNILCLKIVRPSEEDLYYRQTYDRQHFEEERLKSSQEKELIENFKLAQAKLAMKNETKPKKKDILVAEDVYSFN